jgi:hypothetical protein
MVGRKSKGFLYYVCGSVYILKEDLEMEVSPVLKGCFRTWSALPA